MKVVYDQTFENPSDPTWAMLCAEIGKNIDPAELDDDSLKMALHLETHAIKVLRSYQYVRPTSIPRLLTWTFEKHGKCLIASDRHSEAIQDFAEAIRSQAKVAKSGQQDDLNALFEFVENCLQHQLELQQWEDAMGTLK